MSPWVGTSQRSGAHLGSGIPSVMLQEPTRAYCNRREQLTLASVWVAHFSRTSVPHKLL
jgi:hypothetical protein